MEQAIRPEGEVNPELPPDLRPRQIIELYQGFADTIENNPNYPSQKTAVVPGDVTIKQFVGYCRERAGENYTNETGEGARKRFQNSDLLQ